MNESKNRHPLTRVADYGQEYRKQALLASIASILNRLFDLAPPVLIGMAVDVVVSQQNSFLGDFGIIDPVNQLWILGLLTLAVWGLESIFQYFYSILWRNL
ncbi:MAG: ABC transporter, partial [Chloroflexota bacterium]